MDEQEALDALVNEITVSFVAYIQDEAIPNGWNHNEPAGYIEGWAEILSERLTDALTEAYKPFKEPQS